MVVTWNASDKSANITLTAGNLTATSSGATNGQLVRATTSKSAGKWYWELTVTKQAGSGGQGTFGFALGASAVSSNLAVVGDCASCSSGALAGISGSSVASAIGVTFTDGDICNIAVDFDAGKMWFGKNGTWTATGNPATGANPNITFTANTAMFPAWGGFDTSNIGTANFGATAFVNTIPAGFRSFNGGYFLASDAAVFTLTGVASHKAVGIACAAGSFALTGTAALLTKGYHMTCAAGSITFTGAVALLSKYTSSAAPLRAVRFVLQTLRVTAPTLDD